MATLVYRLCADAIVLPSFLHDFCNFEPEQVDCLRDLLRLAPLLLTKETFIYPRCGVPLWKFAARLCLLVFL
jgi:hypothetical protein